MTEVSKQIFSDVSMYNVVIIESVEEFRKLVQEIYDGKYKPNNAVLVLLNDEIKLELSDAVHLFKILPNFKYLCFLDTVLFTNDPNVKEDTECKPSIAMRKLYERIDDIPSPTIVELLRFIGEVSQRDTAEIIRSIKSTTKPEDKWKIVKDALKYDTKQTLQKLFLGLMNNYNDLLNAIGEVVDGVKDESTH